MNRIADWFLDDESRLVSLLLIAICIIMILSILGSFARQKTFAECKLTCAPDVGRLDDAGECICDRSFYQPVEEQ